MAATTPAQTVEQTSGMPGIPAHFRYHHDRSGGQDASQVPPGVAPTHADRIDIAYGRITGLTRQQTDALLRALALHERNRAARFALERPRHLYVLAHALIRVELARMFDCRPQAVHFASTPYGKPYIVAPTPAPQISITHGGTMAACAIAWAGAVGIDVEHISQEALNLDLVGEHFTSHEVTRLAGLDAGGLNEALVAIWTAKEAVVKAHGSGLSMALDRFSVPAGDGFVLGPYEIGTWRVRRLAPDPVHRVAVALGGDLARPVRIHQRTWAPEALVAAIGSTSD